MSKKTEEFFKIMLNLLPSTTAKYRKSIEYNGELLETVVIEDVFMPDIIELLIEDKNIKLLKKIFNYFEEVANCEDEHLINIFSITVLEVMGNNEKVLKIARKYMGFKTFQLQTKVDRELGRG